MVECVKVIYSFLLVFFILLVHSQIFVASSAEKEIPITKVGLGTNVGPTLKFLYCYSCGYRKVFDDYYTLVHQKYPDISIQGGNYDPPGYSMLIAKTLGILKMIAILCIISGINICGYLFGQQQPPTWWQWCTENKLFSCMMIFLVSNAIESQLVSTGAFEISLNDMPVWSKLETGRIPQPPELFQIIDNHLQFDDTIDINRGFAK